MTLILFLTIAKPVCANSFDDKIRNQLKFESHPISLDTYSQILPAAAIYGYSLAGVKAKHSYLDRTLITTTAYLAETALVEGVKYTVGRPRPDNPNEHTSFPSGHTARAFVGAEIARREYWDASPWYGIAAYSVATATGVLRIYNDRHWASDVLAGAGFGILSAQIGYWLLPYERKWLHLDTDKKDQISIVPYYFPQQGGGIGLSYRF
jgi:membrane-associated phospholipid phosphatase